MYTISRVRLYLSFINSFFTLLLLISLLFVDIPSANKDLINILLGMVLGCNSSIIAFYFGNIEKYSKKDNEND